VICDLLRDGELFARFCSTPSCPRHIIRQQRGHDQAYDFLAARGLSDRVECRAGSFFDEIDVLADVYTLKWILHD